VLLIIVKDTIRHEKAGEVIKKSTFTIVASPSHRGTLKKRTY